MMVGLCAPMHVANRVSFLWSAWIEVKARVLHPVAIWVRGRVIGECQRELVVCMLLSRRVTLATEY